MRPTLAEAGCPYCGRQMAPMWQEAVSWECWQITARNQDWAETFDALADVLAATVKLPQDTPGPRWVCPDCDVADWVSDGQPVCDGCDGPMWWAADDSDDRRQEP